MKPYIVGLDYSLENTSISTLKCYGLFGVKKPRLGTPSLKDTDDFK
jgi:hypothetical protein